MQNGNNRWKGSSTTRWEPVTGYDQPFAPFHRPFIFFDGNFHYFEQERSISLLEYLHKNAILLSHLLGLAPGRTLINYSWTPILESPASIDVWSSLDFLSLFPTSLSSYFNFTCHCLSHSFRCPRRILQSDWQSVLSFCPRPIAREIGALRATYPVGICPAPPVGTVYPPLGKIERWLVYKKYQLSACTLWFFSHSGLLTQVSLAS